MVRFSRDKKIPRGLARGTVNGKGESKGIKKK